MNAAPGTFGDGRPAGRRQLRFDRQQYAGTDDGRASEQLGTGHGRYAVQRAGWRDGEFNKLSLRSADTLVNAAGRGDIIDVQHFVNLGVAVDSKNRDDGPTPLIAASERGSLEVVKALID